MRLGTEFLHSSSRRPGATRPGIPPQLPSYAGSQPATPDIWMLRDLAMEARQARISHFQGSSDHFTRNSSTVSRAKLSASDPEFLHSFACETFRITPGIPPQLASEFRTKIPPRQHVMRARLVLTANSGDGYGRNVGAGELPSARCIAQKKTRVTARVFEGSKLN